MLPSILSRGSKMGAAVFLAIAGLDFDENYRLVLSKTIKGHFPSQSLADYFLNREDQVIESAKRFRSLDRIKTEPRPRIGNDSPITMESGWIFPFRINVPPQCYESKRLSPS